MKIIDERRSVRKYTDKKVEAEKIYEGKNEIVSDKTVEFEMILEMLFHLCFTLFLLSVICCRGREDQK